MLRIRLIVAFPALFALVFFLASGLAYSQTDVEVLRPLDGATVRETVRIIVPQRSVPPKGFVAVFLDKRFQAAVSNASQADGSFVYYWNTKDPDPDPTLTEDQRAPREGKRTIYVEVFDGSGKKVGRSKDITVYVKNKADLPASGVRLRYGNKLGSSVDYKCKVTVSLQSIQGATEVAKSVGQAFEGNELTIRRSVEDVRPDNTVLVRQKPVGAVKEIKAGQLTPILGTVPRAAYQIEDPWGRVSSVLTPSSPGLTVNIDLPNLPGGRIAVGDSWAGRDRVLRDVLSGRSLILNTRSTLEGAEWHGGYPCAKIVTEFEGVGVSPFPSLITSNVTVKNGKTISYFAYQVGKLVSSVTTATIEADVEQQVVSQFTEKLVGAQGSYASSLFSGSFGTSGTAPMGGESPPPFLAGGSAPTIGGGNPLGAGAAPARVNMVFDVKQTMELAR